VLQALAPCSSVSQWLSSIVEHRQSLLRYVSTALQNVVKVLNNESVEFSDEYCPSDVMQALQTNGWVISPDEQDAHEMFHVLMETLSEEAVPCSRNLSLFDMNGLEESKILPSNEAISRADVGLHQLAKPEVEQPFRGLLASQLKCKRCAHKCAVKYDSFDSLSLSLPSQCIGSLTLDHLLKRFVMSESVDDVVCDKCCQPTPDGLSRKTSSFVKKLTIGKLPRCLCIHIQRTVWVSTGVPVKRFDTVTFPELLDLSPYVYHKQETVKMQLKMTQGDSMMRLVGGRKTVSNGNCLQSSGKNELNLLKSASSPRMNVPYSQPVNMLKALNYHSRHSHHGDGLYTLRTDITLPGKHTQSSTHDLRMLAAAYSTESLSAARHTMYKLVSVVVHLGDALSGHFITYRRAPSSDGRRFPDKWLYTSDLLVRRASLADVLGSDAYMLLYEKV